MQPLGWLYPEACPLSALVKETTFFGLGNCLGVGIGGAALDGCSTGGVLEGRIGEGMEVLVLIAGDMMQLVPPKQSWTVAQGGPTGGEDLVVTSTFFPKGLFL